MKVKKFDVVIEKDKSGIFFGYVPELPGCYSQGETEKELLGNMREAIELHLETLKEAKNIRNRVLSALEKLLFMPKLRPIKPERLCY